jgi:hypothetical protein
MAQNYLRAPADPLKTLDPSAPKDLQHVVKAMLEAGYTPQQLTSFLSWDHTTIEDWAKGKSLPRSESYRKQLVEVMLAHVSKQANDKSNSTVENSANIGDNPTIMESSLINLFKTRNLPESMWPDTAAEIERIVNERAKAAMRPKWDERGKYDDLKKLSSPAFLKRVYADEIAPDNSIAKEAVRKTDPKLMAAVETYISGREGSQRDMGDAEGLRLIAGPRSRPKRASLG